MTPQEIIHVPQRAVTVHENDFMPILSVEKAVERKDMMNQFINKVLKEGDDYGKMPGESRADAKKVLFKPGAEKLCSIFGMAPQYLEDKIVEDWTGAEHGGEPLFYYSYRCQLMRGDRFMGEAIGSANSWEVKYRYRWVNEDVIESMIDPDQMMTEENYKAALARYPSRGGKTAKFEPDFAIDKRTPEGEKYGHPPEYWDQFTAAGGAKRVMQRELGKRKYNGWEVVINQRLYRIPNPDAPDVINTLQKMAQKRALVAAVLVVTNCSDAFTQDLEDAEPTHGQEAHTAPQSDLPADEPMLILPEELSALFGPDAPAKGTTTAFAIVKRELMEALGKEGEDKYREILNLNNIKDKGNKIGDVKKALIQGWTLARAVKAKTNWKPIPVEGLEERRERLQTVEHDDDWGAGRE